MARERIISLAAALSLLAMLVIGARLTPAPAGHGTHEQLGLPACPFPRNFGLPCATCGMTTAVSLASQGRLGAAIETQPAGAALAVVAASLFWAFLWSAVTGARAGRLWPASWTTPAIWVGLAVLLGAWGFTALTWAG